MASTITKSIGTASRDYSTIAGWEAAQQGNLVSLNEIHIGECYADTPFNEIVSIIGSTTDATRYMNLTVAAGNRHNGTKSGGGVVIDRAGSTGTVISVYDNYTRVEWLRITGFKATSTNWGIGVAGDGLYSQIKNLIVHDAETETSGTFPIMGIAMGQGNFTTEIKVINCQVFNIHQKSTDGNRVLAIGIEGLGKLSIINCSVYNIVSDTGRAIGIYSNQSSNTSNGSTAINNVVFDTSGVELSDDFGTDTGDDPDYFHSDSDYNISSDDSAPGGHSIINKTSTDNFVSVSAGNEDLHIKDGADAIDAGVGPSSNGAVPSNDIDANTRTGTICDVGSDENWGGGSCDGIWHNETPLIARGCGDVILTFNKADGGGNLIIKSGA